jgi:hypothetical protein
MPTPKAQLQLQKALPQQEAFTKLQLNRKLTQLPIPGSRTLPPNKRPVSGENTILHLHNRLYHSWCKHEGTLVIGKDTFDPFPF